jgi:hypothetical protein
LIDNPPYSGVAIKKLEDTAPTPIFPTMQIRTFSLAESTGDAQEKQARS